MNEYYIEKNGAPFKTDLYTWSRWFETADRVVKVTDDLRHCVSTIFIGSGYIMYETMVFTGNSSTDIACVRNATREEAIKTHDLLVKEYDVGPSPLDIIG
jgi:hypothetical protein